MEVLNSSRVLVFLSLVFGSLYESLFKQDLWLSVLFIATHYYYNAAAKSLQSCPTLCDPTDSSPPGFAIPEVNQARTLEWVAISFSNA